MIPPPPPSPAPQVVDPILAPTELRVDVQRAVSPAPAAVLPLSVSASLETLHLDVAQSDVTLVYAVASENLAEGRFTGERGNPDGPDDGGRCADALSRYHRRPVTTVI